MSEEKKVKKKEVIAYYDEYVKRQKKAGINRRHKRILEFLIQFGMAKNHRVLEIGCGIGTVSNLVGNYLKKGGSLTAMDISSKSIEEAKQLWKNHVNIEFVAKNFAEASIDGTYDIIFFPDVLEHIPEELHAAIFTKCNTHLKEDGVILIHIPDPLYLDYVRQNFPDQLQVIDQSLYLDHFNTAIKSSDFYICHLESYAIWHKPIEYQLIVLRKKAFLKQFEAIGSKATLKEKVLFKLNKRLK
jgi:trans-aconitate 2-methyltransferase